MTEDDYTLEVKKETGEKFESKRALDMNMKKYSVLVQTDKSIYQPSDNIQFRVLVLDAHTKPLNTKSVEIFITDGADNRVKQFDKPVINKGVFQSELQLSDQPVMGTWKIHVKVDGGVEHVKSIDVALMLPTKFEVSIDSKPNIFYMLSEIRATVRVKDKFGKIAKGNATVTAEVFHSNLNLTTSVEKSFAINGVNQVNFGLYQDLKITSALHEKVVRLTATFTEHFSGEKVTATTDVKIHKTPYDLTLEKSSEKFKHGLPFYVTARIRFHDKSDLVTDNTNAVKFTVNYQKYRQSGGEASSLVQRQPTSPKRLRENDCNIDTERRRTFYNVHPNMGLAKIDPNLKSNFEQIYIHAEYLDTTAIIEIEKSETGSDQYIIAELKTA